MCASISLLLIYKNRCSVFLEICDLLSTLPFKLFCAGLTLGCVINLGHLIIDVVPVCPFVFPARGGAAKAAPATRGGTARGRGATSGPTKGAPARGRGGGTTTKPAAGVKSGQPSKTAPAKAVTTPSPEPSKEAAAKPG